MILSAVYMLWMFQRVYLRHGDARRERDAARPAPARVGGVVPLCALAIVMGVFPCVFLKPMEPAVREVVEQVQSSQPVRVDANGMQNAEFKCRPACGREVALANVDGGRHVAVTVRSACRMLH